MTRVLFAELLGTAMLLVSVIGSGIMGQSLSDGNTAIALLANAIATGAMLFVIITVLGPISGAHFNPVVTLAFALRKEITPKLATFYVLAQVLGAILGVWATHAMFNQPVLQISQTMHRTGSAQWFSEILATFGLLFVIFGGIRARQEAVPMLVAIYITGAYWFTASTSFANPAVTIARGFSDTFAGIYPLHAPMYILSQMAGLGLALLILPRIWPPAGE